MCVRSTAGSSFPHDQRNVSPFLRRVVVASPNMRRGGDHPAKIHGLGTGLIGSLRFSVTPQPKPPFDMLRPVAALLCPSAAHPLPRTPPTTISPALSRSTDHPSRFHCPRLSVDPLLHRYQTGIQSPNSTRPPQSPAAPFEPAYRKCLGLTPGRKHHFLPETFPIKSSDFPSRWPLTIASELPTIVQRMTRTAFYRIGRYNVFMSDEQKSLLYARVETVLAGEIAHGHLAVGDQLPTEDGLAARFGVSRITVRRAIQNLVSRGLVEIRRGKGTFVAAPKIKQELTEL